MQSIVTRKTFLNTVVVAATTLLLPAAEAAEKKKTLKIGFAQTGAESDWRTANSESMITEAK